jgi:hypothetical protein
VSRALDVAIILRMGWAKTPSGIIHVSEPLTSKLVMPTRIPTRECDTVVEDNL